MVDHQNADIADTLQLRDVAMATIFVYIWGVHLHHLAYMTEPSVCGSDAALCQITLTTCFFTYICLLIYFLIYIFGFSLRIGPLWS